MKELVRNWKLLSFWSRKILTRAKLRHHKHFKHSKSMEFRFMLFYTDPPRSEIPSLWSLGMRWRSNQFNIYPIFDRASQTEKFWGWRYWLTRIGFRGSPHGSLFTFFFPLIGWKRLLKSGRQRRQLLHKINFHPSIKIYRNEADQTRIGIHSEAMSGSFLGE